MIVHLVCGARPNIPKIAPIYKALQNYPSINPVIVHTGQHYDKNLYWDTADMFGLVAPNMKALNLDVCSGSGNARMAKMMTRYETILAGGFHKRPDLVIVVGDVDSTRAAAMTAAKLDIPVAHVEAGLRSYDMRMPEELNRIIADNLSTLRFTSMPSATEVLKDCAGVYEVGNVMIDAIQMTEHLWRRENNFIVPFVLVTVHRPSNVDDEERASAVAQKLRQISEKIPLIFPVHPRSTILKRKLENAPNIRLVEPLVYNEFMTYLHECAFVITDSGGLQEESLYFNKTCLVLRENTERPETLRINGGTGFLVKQLGLLDTMVPWAMKSKLPSMLPKYWDGKAADRICAIINKFLTEGK